MKKVMSIFILIGLSVFNLTGRELDLKSYMELVEKNSKDLKLAEIDQELAKTQEKLARSAIMPIVAGSGSYTRNILDITTSYAYSADLSTGYFNYMDYDYNSDNDFVFALAVEQKIFDMSVFKALEASRKYREMTGTIYEATRQGILTAAKQVYFQTVLLHEVNTVKKATEQNAYESYQDVKKRFDNDLASELDVLQAQVNWQINIPETTKSERNRDLAMSNLKHLAGIKTDEVIVLTDTLSEVPAKKDIENLSSVLSNRPDYRVTQRIVDLRKINISAKASEFYPSLSASGSIGTSISNDEFSLDDGTEFFTLGLSITVPIFYGGSRFAKMDQARQEMEIAQINLSKKQDDIQIEINNINLLLDEASSRIISAETTVKTAENAFGIMEVSSRNGLATQLDLKDARLNLSGAKLNYYSAIYDYLDAFFKWQQATGEGDQLPF